MDVPPRRLLNLAHQIISEGVAYDEEAREAFAEQMGWPDLVEADQATKQDHSARQAASLIGNQDVDAMFMRMWEARQQQSEAQARDDALASIEGSEA